MNIEAKLSFLSQFPLFKVLSDEELRRLEGMIELKIKPKYSFYLYAW